MTGFSGPRRQQPDGEERSFERTGYRSVLAPHVHGESALLDEFPRTDVTSKWLLSSVNSHMS